MNEKGLHLNDFSDFEGLHFEKIDKKYLDLFVVKNIAEGKINITEDIAKKLTKLIPTKPYTFWISMQNHYDDLQIKTD